MYVCMTAMMNACALKVHATTQRRKCIQSRLPCIHVTNTPIRKNGSKFHLLWERNFWKFNWAAWKFKRGFSSKKSILRIYDATSAMEQVGSFPRTNLPPSPHHIITIAVFITSYLEHIDLCSRKKRETFKSKG